MVTSSLRKPKLFFSSQSVRKNSYFSGITDSLSTSRTDYIIPLILMIVIMLVALGLIMVSSASMISSMKRFGDPFFFFKRQLLFAIIGFIVMGIVATFSIDLIRKLTLPLLLIATSGLIICLTPMGTTVKGASRWISIGIFNFQPSEVAKIAIVFYTAHSMARKVEKIKSFTYGFFPNLLVGLILSALCIKEPDFGSGVMILLLCLCMLFVGGTRIGYILAAFLMMIPVGAFFVYTSPYRMRRLVSFMNPEEDVLGINYQINESLISIGSGGIFGKGIGEGQQKLFFLPDAHTDFIASIIGEELGFTGLVLITVLFVILVVSIIMVALRSKDLFNIYLSFGVALYLGLQSMVNFSVVMGLLPTKGMTLPFISYGGSSLISNLFAIGVVVAIARSAGSRGSSQSAGLNHSHMED